MSLKMTRQAERQIVTEEDPFIQRTEEIADDPFKPHSTYGSGVGYGIGINYIIGTGVFSLPYAFYSAGMGLSLVTLAISSIFSFFCVNWVLEVLARAEGIVRRREKEHLGEETQKSSPDHTIAWRKFDFTTLFDLFSGLKGKLFCQLVICIYCYGVCWAYGAVFASSVSSLFYQFVFKEHCDLYNDPSQGCTNAYYICVLIYALIVVPLACRDMEEQAVIQMIMTGYRFSAFGVMLLTVIVAFFHPNPFEAASGHSLVQWNGFSIVFTSVAVATNFHYNVPDVVKPIRNKSILNRIVSASLCTALLFYVLVGVICGIYFKKSVQPLVTLNWLNYTGIDGGWGGHVADRPWWAAAVQLWVMLFPVFDMISIYPLVGITLGNNILETLPESFKIKFFTRPRLLKIGTRLLATVPSLCFALGLGRLDSIFTFTGLFAFFLELIFPCILQLLSIRMCIRLWWSGAEKTPYSSIMSHPILAWITLVFGVCGMAFAVVTFILQLAGKPL